MINHGPFTQFLADIRIDGKLLPNDLFNEIAIMTRDGVIKEGGPLARDAQPHWRADALLTGFGVAPEAEIPKVVAAKPMKSLPPAGFKFGAASEKELTGVDIRLVKCAQIALTYSTIDFCCYDGIRTFKQQQQYVKDGTSKTMESKHLDGLAVDLVPWINGKPTWDWDGCYQIALAMDRAATELGIANKITWGGAWDRRLSDFGGDAKAYLNEVGAYRIRHPGKDFIDGPHFEIRT